jgi:hypothetical protein
MRKSKQFPRHGSRFRSLVILTGALMLLAAFTPKANADLIAYFNFEGTPTPPYPVNLMSSPLGFETTTLILTDGLGNPYPVINTSAEAGIPLNVVPGDPDPNLTSLGVHHSGSADLAIDIPLPSSQGFFQDMTVSFAINVQGNGYSLVTLFYSTNGGTTFTAGPSQVLPPAGNMQLISLAVPTAANNAPNLVLRLLFTGGQSNGANLQDTIDNIQINGTIVPEPATVAGGLLGVLGLCWFQRRRLIRSVRFRRA